MEKHYKFNNVSLLITHYNRSNSLERLLKRFDELNCQFSKIIVSDDCSSKEHQININKIRENREFEYVTSKINGGLGNNINKGQDLVNSELTLYVQEDFSPTNNFPDILQKSISIMQNSEFDIIRFYAYGKYKYLKDYDHEFSEMIFNFWPLSYKKYYFYSDHPHLRRSNFFEKFGRYAEGYNPEQTEYRMMMSFVKNNGKGLFYNKFKDLFDHLNTQDEPSTMKRSNWRRGKNPIISVLREVYRFSKFNINYIFTKKIKKSN